MTITQDSLQGGHSLAYGKFKGFELPFPGLFPQ